jgi:hypothetical protein
MLPYDLFAIDFAMQKSTKPGLMKNKYWIVEELHRIFVLKLL